MGRTLDEMFWAQVRKSPGDGCWEWTGLLSNNGYGRFTMQAHRISIEIAGEGLTPEKPCALHKCDNRKCVRPDHLWAGTKDDNNKDTMRKGRRLQTICRSGRHKIEPGNILGGRGKDGRMRRWCKTCKYEAIRRFKKKNRKAGV